MLVSHILCFFIRLSLLLLSLLFPWFCLCMLTRYFCLTFFRFIRFLHFPCLQVLAPSLSSICFGALFFSSNSLRPCSSLFVFSITRSLLVLLLLCSLAPRSLVASCLLFPVFFASISLLLGVAGRLSENFLLRRPVSAILVVFFEYLDGNPNQIVVETTYLQASHGIVKLR
jgi:hypothetical protein